MAQVDITGRNLVVVGVLATVFIILLKTGLRFIPVPAIVKQKVGEV